jgi:hypothetical protein
MISLNPKKAKKKLKKAARAEDSACVDSRLPVDKFDADSIEVVPPVSLNSKKPTSKKPKTAPAAVPARVVNKFAPTLGSTEFTPTFKLDGPKKSWYDITVDDDDDFLGAVSNY